MSNSVLRSPLAPTSTSNVMRYPHGHVGARPCLPFYDHVYSHTLSSSIRYGEQRFERRRPHLSENCDGILPTHYNCRRPTISPSSPMSLQKEGTSTPQLHLLHPEYMAPGPLIPCQISGSWNYSKHTYIPALHFIKR